MRQVTKLTEIIKTAQALLVQKVEAGISENRQRIDDKNFQVPLFTDIYICQKVYGL